jgi:hypothetical protein
MASPTDSVFEDYDTPGVYDRCREFAERPIARNFVLEFNSDRARIALNLDQDRIERLIKYDDSLRCSWRPVRWM